MVCPTPSKVPYPDEHEARRAAAAIRCDLRGPALTPYRCACGLIHLTSGQDLTAKIRGALAGGGR